MRLQAVLEIDLMNLNWKRVKGSSPETNIKRRINHGRIY